jgi:amino acid permease
VRVDAYAINYVIGIGILGIPFAMVQAGILLASGVLLLVVILSGMTAVWIVEVLISIPYSLDDSFMLLFFFFFF